MVDIIKFFIPNPEYWVGLKVVPILSYGENPTVKYSSANNTLYITVKQKTNDTPVIDYIQEKKTEITLLY